MSWCSACGGRPPADAAYCPSCGSRLPQNGARATVEQVLVGAPGGDQGVGHQQATAGPPPGWYDDPHGVSALRYWTGEVWSHVVAAGHGGPSETDASWTTPVPAAWLPDPQRKAPLRWWDGTQFTRALSNGQATWEEGTVRVSW